MQLKKSQRPYKEIRTPKSKKRIASAAIYTILEAVFDKTKPENQYPKVEEHEEETGDDNVPAQVINMSEYKELTIDV